MKRKKAKQGAKTNDSEKPPLFPKQEQTHRNDNGEEKQPLKEINASASAFADEAELLKQFDHKAASLKAEATEVELVRLGKSLEHSISSMRAAEHTISAYTLTERSRKVLISNFPRIPSELMHAKIKYAQNKFKIRQQLLSLQRYIFDLPPRPEPRFGFIGKDDLERNGDNSQQRQGEYDPTRDNATVRQKTAPSDVSDDGNEDIVDSETVICCVCHDGTSTRHNDIVLCEGLGCFRAFHMGCVRPKLTLKDLKNQRYQEDDWFCPYCTKVGV